MEKGNLIVDTFQRLFEGVTVDDEHEEGIALLIDSEFEMFRHYLLLVNGNPKFGTEVGYGRWSPYLHSRSYDRISRIGCSMLHWCSFLFHFCFFSCRLHFFPA